MFKDLDSNLIWESYQDFLIEGRKDRYLQMFQFVPKEDGAAWNYINKEMAWALKILKTEDKIIWFLNILKYIVLSMQAISTPEGSKLRKMGEKQGYKIGYNFPNERPNISERFHNQMEHYLTQGVDVLDNYRITDLKKTPDLVMQELSTIEKEYFESAKDSIKMSDRDEIIIEFDDGSVWVNTHTPTCTSEESKIMQHCGNQYGHQASGDEIFSFRTPSNIKGRWNPHLTFVINDGIIRESKGKQNEKPDVDKYGKYIFELLKSDYITGFSQYDTHAAGKNLYLTDLPDKWVEELREIKDDDFFEDSEQEDLDDKAKKLFEQYTFKDILVDYDVEDYGDGEGYISANAGFTIIVQLKENHVFDEGMWDDDIIKSIIGIDMRISEDGISHKYNKEKQILKISVWVDLTTQEDLYGTEIERFEEFLDNCKNLDRNVPDGEDIYDGLIESSIILPVFGQLYQDLTEENTETYIENVEEKFPELEFFDIEFDDPTEMTFEGTIILGQLTDVDDAILDGMEKWDKKFISNFPDGHPIRLLQSVMTGVSADVKILIKSSDKFLELFFTTKMEYDEDDDKIESYQEEYADIRKIDYYLDQHNDDIQRFFKEYIVPALQNKIELTADNIKIEKKSDVLGTMLYATYGDVYLSNIYVAPRNADRMEEYENKLIKHVLDKMPYVYGATYDKNLFQNFLDDPEMKPSFYDPRQQQFKFEKKIIRFKKIFYG